MEVNTQRRKAGLDEKIPDIQKTLETVRFLKTRKVRLSSSVTLPSVKLLRFAMYSPTQIPLRLLSSSMIHSTLKLLSHLRMKSTYG